MDIKFVDTDLDLTRMEKAIVSMVIKKKKLDGFKNIIFDKSFFNFARKSATMKKTEDGLKFIFKKAIKYIKSNFFFDNPGYDLERSL